jgi:hypothetical protein
MRLILALLLMKLTLGSAAQIPVLGWTERSDWINVKTDVSPAAVGDGVADDTLALRAALSMGGHGTTIYFPPGTYKITGTITNNCGTSRTAVNLIGHGRSTTIKWFGAAGGNMIQINGNPRARYEGLILDGRNLAASGFYQFNTLYFETEIRYRHVGLYNFTGAAIYTPANDTTPSAETSYENCIFDHCAIGMRMGSFNDYDHTFAGCDFISCGTGILCENGNYYVRECYFQGSTVADIDANPEHACTVRRSKSVGSKQFLIHRNGVTPITVEDCYVSGWTGPNGAIQATQNVPVFMTHTRFVSPPDALAPVRLQSGQRVVDCNNVAPSSPSVYTAGATIYSIPVGTQPARVGSTSGANITSFIKDPVTVPTTIYDVKAYGAVGNGVANDTVAVQNAINAARTAGNGGIVFFPNGVYRVSSTISVTGANYVLGGNGYFSRLEWAGPAGIPMVSVADANNVRFEHLNIGENPGVTAPAGNSADIEQTSTGAISRVDYDGLYVFGRYNGQPEIQGLRLNGLGANCTVVISWLVGNIRGLNAANANVLANVTYEGGVTVDHTSATRTGFLGLMTRLTTLKSAITVRNNNNIVLSDWYAEQGERSLVLSGAAGDPAGRVSIHMAKSHYFNPPYEALNVNNYQGKVFIGSAQFYLTPTNYFVQSGSRPINVVLLGCTVFNTRIQTSGSTYNYVGNLAVGSGIVSADNYTAQTLSDTSLMVDDMRRLGNFDLDLNFSHVSFAAPAAPSGLSATAASSSQINLAWTDNSGDETGFKIERKTGAGGTYAQIGTVGANITTFNDTGLAASTAYYYRVRANNASGDSAYSNEANATTLAGGLPDLIVTAISWSPASPAVGSAVTFSATIKNQGAAATPGGIIHGVSFWVDGTQVSWSDTSTTSLAVGATRVLTANSGPTGSAAWTATSGTHTILANVDDVNRMAESNESNNTFTTSLTPSSLPAAPSGLSATAASSSQINLAWTDNANNETGFKIERKTGAGGTYAQINTVGANITTYNDTGLSASTAYYYRVRANNAAGDSAYSNEANATTAAPGSPDLIVTAISWSPASPGVGDAVIFSATIKNQGTAATPAGIVHGVSFWVDGVAVNWSDTSTASLAAGATRVLTANSGPSGLATWTATSGTHTILANVDDVNRIVESNESNNTLSTPLTPASLPSPWQTSDIGAVAAAGSAAYSAGTFTVNGSGADIWGTADEFRYVYQTSTGDCEMRSRVATIQNTDVWAKAGVMIRETTVAGSMFAAVFITPGNGVSFQQRTTTGGTAVQVQVTGITAPRYVRVLRSGSTFSGYYSSDGTTWTQIGSNVTITMASSATIGLAVTSHNDGVVCTATLDNAVATP